MVARLEALEIRRLLAVYHLDRAWAELGVASIDPPVSGDIISLAFAHQYTDGSVLGIGEELNADVTQPALVKLLSSGLPDTSFGTNGIRRAPFDLGIYVGDVASDGSIWAAGLNHEFKTASVAHFLASGAPDTQFGNGGIVGVLTATDAAAVADVVPLDSGGALALAYEIGTQEEEINEQLIRLKPDGSLDSNFGADGSVPIQNFARTITLQQDGRIVLGGGDTFIRLMPDGSEDLTFGNNGTLVLPIDSTKSDSQMLADGRLFATTSYYGEDLNLPAEIRRFNADGTLDTTFGNNGIAIFSTGDSTVFDLKIDGDGNIVAYGQSGNSDKGFGPVLARYTPDGQPDQTFAENGAFQLAGLMNASPGRMELESDGSILLTAGTYPGAFLAKVTSAAGQEVFLSDNGTLFVDGTTSSDTIQLTRSGASVHLIRNGTSSDFAAADVSRIVVDAMAGDDEISFSGALPTADIHAGDGSDSIHVVGGTYFYVYGGDGDDMIVASDCNAALNGEEGNNTVQASNGGFVITCASGNDTITANLNDQGEGDEGSIFAGDGDNVVNCSGTGQFRIDTGSGRDSITSGAGDDNITAGEGDDTIDAGGGDDAISGYAGDDVIRGGDGNDSIYGSEGNDSLYGNAGADHIWGEEGSDLLSGGGGRDHLAGGAGADRVYGGRGNDVMDGGSGKDHLYGQDGDDKLNGSLGDDTLAGGAGSDQLIDSRGDDQLVE